MTETNPYTFIDNPTESGVAVCNTDILNEDIMYLKWLNEHNVARHIGEIITSTIPLTDAGLHLLDGSLLSYGSYKDFIDYMAGLYNDGNYSFLFATEANWQQSITDYGVCGKFVYNSTNNTVRLPKVTGFTESTNTISNLGDVTAAGLPNITGITRGMSGGSGAFSSSAGSGTWGGSTTTIYDNSFDASRSSSIYGNSSTVQPQSIKVLYYIVIATTTRTDIQVDIDEIVTDLNGKADKTDLAEVQCVIQTYSNGASWYRVWSDGWCEQGGRATDTSAVTINLLKHYINTNYSVLINGIENTNSTATITPQFYGARTLTTSSFVLQTSSSLNNVVWYTCGYIS